MPQIIQSYTVRSGYNNSTYAIVHQVTYCLAHKKTRSFIQQYFRWMFQQ